MPDAPLVQGEPSGSGASRFIPPALRYPLYRRYWLGLLASVFGYRMFQFAQFWLAYELTGSALWLGFVGLADAIPAIVLNLVGGAAADRVDRRRLVMWTEVASGIIVTGLGLLVLTEGVQPWHVLVAVGSVAGINAFNQPARVALYPNYVDRPSLLSAVALNSVAWQLTRIAGPALAGVVIALTGTEVSLFVAATGMFGMALVMNTLPAEKAVVRRRTKALGDILDGVRFIAGNRLFLFLIGMTFFNSFFAMSYVPLMPIFAVDILRVGAEGQGLLIGTSGIGAVLATTWVSTRSSSRGKGAFLIGGATLAGLSLVAFALTSRYVGSFALALALIFAVGVFTSTYMISVTTSLQLMVPDELRGRVMGFWGMTWNIMPLGALFAGALAEVITVPWAVAVGGMAVTAFALGPALFNQKVRSLGRIAEETAAMGAGPAR
jgi:MFS family permease